MGLHQICQNPYHYFDREASLEMIYDELRGDYVLIGLCLNCNSMRIVYFNQLRYEKVVEAKMKGAYYEYIE